MKKDVSRIIVACKGEKHRKPLRCWKGGALVTCLIAMTKYLENNSKKEGLTLAYSSKGM